MTLRTLTLLGSVGFSLATLGLVACDESADGSDDLSTASMALSASAPGDIGAAAVRYTVDRVACAAGDVFEPLSETADVPVLDITLSDALAASGASPMDAASAHLFADRYEVVPAGCYDVSATALNAAGDPVAECAAASQLGVEVFDGLTTEILLLIQCHLDESGGIDAIAALNQPPTITALTYSPSKFATDCDDVTICASAVDPDGDPITFAWANAESSGAGIVATTVETVDDVTTACATFPSGNAGSHGLAVSAFDNLYDDAGALMTIEDWFAAVGTTASSHDELLFPLYVAAGDCGASLSCPADGHVTDPALFSGQPVQDWQDPSLSPSPPFSLDGLTYEGWWFTSTGWCIPGMDSNSPGCGGTNRYLAGDGNGTLTPAQAAQAIGFKYGTQGSSFTVVVHLTDGSSESFVLTDPAPGGWGVTGYFGYCAASSGALIDYLEISSPDRGIDDVTCVGCQ